MRWPLTWVAKTKTSLRENRKLIEVNNITSTHILDIKTLDVPAF